VALQRKASAVSASGASSAPASSSMSVGPNVDSADVVDLQAPPQTPQRERERVELPCGSIPKHGPRHTQQSRARKQRVESRARRAKPLRDAMRSECNPQLGLYKPSAKTWLESPHTATLSLPPFLSVNHVPARFLPPSRHHIEW
jgi:hypothetical protein